jgi:hypothetical protein
MRYYLESIFTTTLWALWIFSVYLVGKDLFSGAFLGYAKPLFWLMVLVAGIFIAVALGLFTFTRKTPKKNQEYLSADEENRILRNFFGMQQAALESAKLTKNIFVEFPSDDQRCLLHPATTEILTA